ncbi:MAG: hypothetical protein ACI4U9_03340 [Clostridia bacterium]
MKKRETIRIILAVLVVIIGGFLGGYAPNPIKYIVGLITGMTAGSLIAEREDDKWEQEKKDQRNF